MNKMLKIVSIAWLAIASSVVSVQANEVLDRVAVIVNDGVILQSEVDAMLAQIKRNAAEQDMSLPSDKVLRVQAIDRLVLQEVQLQIARRAGIEVSDAQLEQTIQGIAQESNLTVDQLRNEIERLGSTWSSYRESVRKEMMLGEVQRGAVRERVYISPQEINNLSQMLEEMNEKEVEYRLSHILVGLRDGSGSDEVQDARERAEQLLELLRKGADFAETAVSSSSGSRALEGGDLGWMNINAMPTLFAEAVRDKRKGDLIGPIKSGVGFHILKVADTRGLETVEVEEVNARHILLQPSVILSDKRAKEKLEEIRAQIVAGEASFEDMAREHSSDPGSASQGGDLGWSQTEVYDPAFKRVVDNAEVGVISEPFKSQFGWHIVEVLDRRIQDATERSKQNRAYQLLFRRKYQEELENWQQEIRDQAYIEQVVK
ncbi:peptidylprolyl isomerase SurA [Pseudidiomarina halophila]|uniref:Chaperone SurA n=1 Tax=Pseudidiomarina halophila TaxID=1449799 RepID=A0A432XS53_9GAMM|nr:peptidylprolyl isomerase SurA [Pseudidiomarina halophila]RUO51504.1 peptidylprolyl isomerase SurA [Pseudidiomarina halophila]